MQGTRAEPVRWRPRRSDGSVRARSFAATVSLLAAAGGLVGVAVHESQPWLFGGMSALAVLAAAGMSRRSVVAQILARGAAWTLFGPSALGAVVSLVFDGRFEGIPWAFAGASGLALLLGRPMLHTDQARAEFAPVRFRRWLLAGAVASVAVAAATGIIGALFVSVGELGSGSALLALTGALLASGVGVARMRAWGVLLGMLSSAVVCVTALALQHHAAGVLLATAALPDVLDRLPDLIVAEIDRLDQVGDANHVGASGELRGVRREQIVIEQLDAVLIAQSRRDQQVGALMGCHLEERPGEVA